MSPSNARKLIEYLPAVLQEDKLLQDLLAPYEQIFIASGDSAGPKSLEAIIAGLSDYFDPNRAPSEFLPWLPSCPRTTRRPFCGIGLGA